MIDENELILYLNDLALMNSPKDGDEESETYKTLIDIMEIIEQQPKMFDDTYIKVPFKIGDDAYAIRNYSGKNHVVKGVISEMYLNKENRLVVVIYHVCRGLYGEDVFETMEEAEEVLRSKNRWLIN